MKVIVMRGRMPIVGDAQKVKFHESHRWAVTTPDGAVAEADSLEEAADAAGGK